jgi:hypothetical protein
LDLLITDLFSFWNAALAELRRLALLRFLSQGKAVER